MAAANHSTAQQLQLHLVPQPGSRPEFLASCVLEQQVVDANAAAATNDNKAVMKAAQQQKAWESLIRMSTAASRNEASSSNSDSSSKNKLLVLEGYTRDAWAWKPAPSSMVDVTLRSVDGRNKLPGFVKYLKERQKSAYGRFGPKGLLVVSYIRPKNDDNSLLHCRVALDMTAIPTCTLRPLVVTSSSSSSDDKKGNGDKPQQQQAQKTQQQRAQPHRAPSAAAGGPAGAATKGPTATGGRGGLLGKLVGAQQRTNQHMISTYSSSKAKAAAAADPSPGPATATGSSTSDDPYEASNDDHHHHTNSTSNPSPTSPLKAKGGGGGSGSQRTAQEVFAEFRQSMMDKMLDFDMAESDDEMRVTVSLSEHTAGLVGEDDRSKVTMEVLKYMVYEAAEEVNEEWVVHKEPSEFVDEATFCVYKEGMAPPEVLEEINRAELPDEIKAQQRAITAERQRQADQANQQHLQKVMLQAASQPDYEEDDDQLEALNQKKRDRRTIEDYERERRELALKKGRT